MNFNKILDKLAKADLTDEQETQLMSLLEQKKEPDKADQKVDTANPKEVEKADDKEEQKPSTAENEVEKSTEEVKVDEVGKEGKADEPQDKTTAGSDQEEDVQDSNLQVNEVDADPNFVGRPIGDFVLKEDVDKQIGAFTSRIDSLEKTIASLTDKLQEAENGEKALKEKYESKTFGEYSSKFMGSEEPKNSQVEKFDDYFKKF